MSLISNVFIIFVLAAVLCYYLAPMKIRWVILLIFSYIYYLAGGVRYLFFIIYSTIVVFLFGLAIDRLQKKNASAKVLKRVITVGVILSFLLLGIVKYLGFFTNMLNNTFGTNIPGFAILFPLGISFYTFQSVGYLLDVYWKKAEAEKNIFRFALFISFFPQLMQGPIGNYNRLAPQLITPHALSKENIIRGLSRIIWGYAKKMIIADWAGIFADAIWDDPDRYNGIVLFGLVFYGIQLYADFSGGIDVVIGIGNLFGIQMDENFNMPYLATSMADFWKRWHITLGEWMMNYVFYPITLSGWMTKFSGWSRKTFGKKTGRVVPIALADFIVFFLVGIWHGASWKYVMYGLINGGIIGFSELMGNNYRKWKKALNISGKEKWYHIFQIIRTYIIVNLRWFYDRSETVTEGNYLVKQAFTHFNFSQIFDIAAGRGGTEYVPVALLIIIVGCIVMVTVGVLKERGINLQDKLASMPLPAATAVYIVLFLIIGMLGSTAIPKGFIYAQF
ncbi:MAG: MBOAT family protein [Lachnospiraceae bacterium]|nr:MBOAT family protein [Lachnospiraceae bacterium]